VDKTRTRFHQHVNRTGQIVTRCTCNFVREDEFQLSGVKRSRNASGSRMTVPNAEYAGLYTQTRGHQPD